READGMPTDREATIRELARAHDLDISGTVTVNELGADFQVAIAEAADGLSWVLRIPRRPDAANRAAVDGRFLSAIAPHLSVAAPEWQIRTAELIAYPFLPGDPGLTIDERGGPGGTSTSSPPSMRPRSGTSSPNSTPSIRRWCAHPRALPAEARQRKREGIDRVVSEFEVAPELSRLWGQWLDDDSYRPTFTTVTHGEVHPDHQLVDGPADLSSLDWTTAAISDPARDFMFPGQGSRPRPSKRRSPATCKPVVESGRDSATPALSSLRPPRSNSACSRCRQEIPSFCQRREPN